MNGSQIVSEIWGNNTLIYLYDETGSPIGMQYRTSSMEEGEFVNFFFEKNLFGDIVAIYNEAGNKIGSYKYDAWGICTTSVQSTASTFEQNIVRDYNPFRYRGYYYDTETEFYYLQSRYYDPVTGRFLNADGYINANGDMIGYNMYTYCSNNPVMYTDTTGTWPRWITATVSVVAAVVATVAPVVAAPGVAATAVTVAAVAAVAYVAQSHHYDKRKEKNTNLPKTPQQAEKWGWKNSNPLSEQNPNGGGPAADCHQYTSPDKTNVKYVSPDGHKEVIFDSAENMVLDSRDIGTYNLSPSGTFWGDFGHLCIDIIPWVIFGNDDDDPGPVLNEVVRWFE